MKKLLISVISFMFLFSLFSVISLADENESRQADDQTVTAAVYGDIDENDDEDLDENKDEDKSKNRERNNARKEAHKAWEAAKDKLEAEKDAIEAAKDELEAQVKALEEKIEAAEEAGDEALVADLKEELASLKTQLRAKKEEFKQAKEKMMAEFKNKIKDKRHKYQIIDGEKIKVKGKKFDADTPPVIREGRTLIPLRAVVSALGAEVKWNAETKEVTITRDDTVIVINTETNVTTINGVKVEVKAEEKSENLANRTYVPFRFIAATLGDEVNYDKATGEITIGE